MHHWNSPALVQADSKLCFILNKKESALQWMQYENKPWLLWVKYCSFYSYCCPQWDESSRNSEKNLTLGSWCWGQNCFKDLLVGIFFLWHSPLGLSVDLVGGGQNTQMAWRVLMQGSNPCLGLLKLPSMCWFPAVEWAPWLLLHLGLQECEEEDCTRRSPVCLHMNLPSYKNAKTIITYSGSGKVMEQTIANNRGGRIQG